MHRTTARIFLKALALVYLAAFLSLWPQVLGLIGREGIAPACEFLEFARGKVGPDAYRLVPTFCWLNASDAFLQLLCGAGAVLSVLLFLGVAPVPVLLVLWASYLSLASVSQEFLQFQWDALLLETGLLAVFLAPLTLRLKASVQPEPSRLALFLLRWLLFRFMFSSGVVKLASGDPAWRNLTALLFHYETQPLPTWVGWYAHQLPAWFQRVSCVGMFFTELAVPFFIFGPRRLRLLACAILVAFQVLIAVTGNYAFFNALTVALCLLLLDDPFWRRLRVGAGAAPAPPVGRGRWPAWILAPIAAVVLMLSGMELLATLRVPVRWPEPAVRLWNLQAPFRAVNGYGLFAVMTTSRPEIVVEGSEDGVTWKEYEFRFKPGDLRRRPGFVAPHQPRLDWQMWFAALGSPRENPWLISFCVRLLQGSPAVLRLLRTNPFPDQPPRHVRALLYDYRFTDPGALRREGAWWRRKELGLYLPPISLKKGRAQPPE